MSTPRLQWKAPDGREQVFLMSSAEIVIGRTTTADIVLPGQRVSRQHAKIMAIPDGHQVIDLSSSYGTFVNDKRIDQCVLQNGDKISFGKDDTEVRYFTESQGKNSEESSRNVEKSLDKLGTVFPAAATDLEKILCVLDFQEQWGAFTPEKGLEQILKSALKISGAERSFIMTRKGESFGYAAGFDSKGHSLLESHFHTSRSVVRDVAINDRPLFMVEGIHGDFAEQASIVNQNLRAIACLPLRGIPTGGDSPVILGILYLDSTKAMHSLSGLDERILNKLAVEAGTLLERVETIKSIEQRKTLERDLALAEETQRSLLPREIPILDYVSLVPFSRPTHYVGGDFYDFEVMESGELIASLADVSGKGVAASLLSSMLLGCLQLQLRTGSSPQQTLSRLNKFLSEKSSGKFVTMFVYSLRPDGNGEFISAGHNPGYVYRAMKNEIEELHSNSLILGAFDFAEFTATPFELHRGDILLIYSDGLTEAEDPSGQMFGEERVKEILLREGVLGAKQVHQVLLSVIQEFTHGRAQTDDMTFVIAQRT